MIILFSGLRGAMAYALSLLSSSIFVENNYGNIMLNITLMIVIINVILKLRILFFVDIYISTNFTYTDR